ncbi:F0F1 ATP synthase subunit delta [Nitrosomonas aestuarii]|uniref:F0F1 ATP synthase subunit delta n=1 Tax=Nitrosomonas aestuarii TaxID=52441 RepID=UPI000D319203|nr:F0F1 ATP synthase subunit delta [Nitrosomonas aestuarii]PTN12186.1 ATP synthase F0 subcomplex B subunit [Nitrosomonas aestuarii]
MDFDWTTFILEIINFLILIWILKRFLYQPVLNAITRRREDIEKKLADAQRIEAEANELKHRNEQYLAEWEVKKENEQAQLNAELAALRESKLAELEVKITEEAQRRRVLDERRQADFQRLIEEQGIAQGAQFSSKLLTRLASPELEDRLYVLLLEDLQGLHEQNRHIVTEAMSEPGLHIKVQSAFSLDEQKRNELTRLLFKMTDRALPIEFHINPELISGFQIDIGPWILHANLRDELKFFSGALRHAG